MTLYYRRKRIKRLFFIILPSLIISLSMYFYIQISKNFSNLSEDTVYSTCFNLINEVIANNINEVGKENIIEYKYGNNGEIIAVNANVVTMNKLNVKISEEIVEKFSQINNLYVKIPLGSFLSSKIFAAAGPNIPIKILPLSTIHTEYATEFTSTGINQTQHKIFIKINCTLSVLSALSRNTQQINIEIPIAETIIVGDVPSTFVQIPTK